MSKQIIKQIFTGSVFIGGFPSSFSSIPQKKKKKPKKKKKQNNEKLGPPPANQNKSSKGAADHRPQVQRPLEKGKAPFRVAERHANKAGSSGTGGGPPSRAADHLPQGPRQTENVNGPSSTVDRLSGADHRGDGRRRNRLSFKDKKVRTGKRHCNKCKTSHKFGPCPTNDDLGVPIPVDLGN